VCRPDAVRRRVGKDLDVPVGFAAIRLRFDLDSPRDADSRATLLRLTERYCVAYQTLTGGVPIELSAEQL
jgi:uncharacterized OsmC-like protein